MLDTLALSDYGQIDIFDAAFDVSRLVQAPLHSPSQCIRSMRSYTATLSTSSNFSSNTSSNTSSDTKPKANYEVPVMIGSRIHSDTHPHDNPLGINGYFIIDGICKHINNIKTMQKHPIGYNYAVMPDGTCLYIKSMGFYYRCPQHSADRFNKKYRWYIPMNYKEICMKASSPRDRVRLLAFFTTARHIDATVSGVCRDELVLHILSSLFLRWINEAVVAPAPAPASAPAPSPTSTNPGPDADALQAQAQAQAQAEPTESTNSNIDININYRIITPGEYLAQQIRRGGDVIAFMRSNQWKLGSLVFTISEDMHSYNVLHDIEAVRRVTLIGDREHMGVAARTVQDAQRYRICPVQTSSGALTGTVEYIARGAKIRKHLPDERLRVSTANAIVFFNGKWNLLAPPEKARVFESALYIKLYEIDRPQVYPESTLTLAGSMNSALNPRSIKPLSLADSDTESESDAEQEKLEFSSSFSSNFSSNLSSSFNDTAGSGSDLDDQHQHNSANLSPKVPVYAMWPDTGVLEPQLQIKQETAVLAPLLSVTPSLIPYANHNPPVRAMFACSMMKQAIAKHLYMHEQQTQNQISIVPRSELVHGEQPLIGPELPALMGHNLLVGIMPWYGFNVEDAIVISDTAAAKFRSVSTIVHKHRGGALIEQHVYENAYVKNGELLATLFKDGEILNVYAEFNDNNSSEAKIAAFEYMCGRRSADDTAIHEEPSLFIVLEVEHRLEVGDKMASRHGQKGVVSRIVPHTEMPWRCIPASKTKAKDKAKTGGVGTAAPPIRERLELLINPHAFPSRMTMGQIVEMGNTCYPTFIPIASSSSSNPPTEPLTEPLTESLTEPLTEIQTDHDVLSGTCFYMALRHQVNNKIQYRAAGDHDPTYMQPLTSPFRKNGGVRFGLMERDLLLTTHAFKTLDHLREMDKVTAYICSACGRVYTYSPAPTPAPTPDLKSRPTLTELKGGECCANSANISSTICNKALLILIAHMRSVLLDIRWKPRDNCYRITDINASDLQPIHGSNLKFGFDNVLDIRAAGGMPVLPTCLRTPQLHKLYTHHLSANAKDIGTVMIAHMRMLKGKSGIFHKYVEGNKIEKSVRSVIVPNPELTPNVVAIPRSSNIGTTTAILNRQPSLSLESFMAMTLVKSSTNCIEINPLICGPFNADFDGDEMVVYGVKAEREDVVAETQRLFPTKLVPTQDFKFAESRQISLHRVTEMGLTMTKEHAELMIESKSKGSAINLKHIYNKLGDIYLEGKIAAHSNKNYMQGLDENSWYIACKAAREAAVSISTNTPYTGDLYTRSMNILL